MIKVFKKPLSEDSFFFVNPIQDTDPLYQITLLSLVTNLKQFENFRINVNGINMLNRTGLDQIQRTKGHMSVQFRLNFQSVDEEFDKEDFNGKNYSIKGLEGFEYIQFSTHSIHHPLGKDRDLSAFTIPDLAYSPFEEEWYGYNKAIQDYLST